MIVRFKASDGSFTLTQADALYNSISSLITGQDLGSVTVTNFLPSENHSNGITGEGLTDTFLTEGTGVCLSGGVPVDAVGFVSAFRCEYQNQNQMCFRLYVDTGDFDLSMIGVPQQPTGIGGVFIKREVWDAAFGLIMSNPDLLDGLSSQTMQGRAAFSQMLEPVVDPVCSVVPCNP